MKAMAGEKESGDRYLIKFHPLGALVAVVDGLGHGEEAAKAADKAIAILEENPQDSLISLIDRCHRELIGTRGVVVTLASFDKRENIMTWLGVGNVEGVLLRADPEVTPGQEYALLRRGVVGSRLPAIRATILRVMSGDTLIFATDGIRSGFETGLRLNGSPQQIADRIFSKHALDTDDALVLVSRYGGLVP